MGAVTFSLDMKLVTALQNALHLRNFVETGTFEGDTVAEAVEYFDKIISIELSEELAEKAAARFSIDVRITILRGSSPEKLAGIQTYIKNQSVMFWLDAHWCVATGTAGELSQCPLLDELEAIKTLNLDSVILIDDARLFLAPPLAPHEISHWPSFDKIVRKLFSMSEHHELMVVNDIIAFFPKSARSAIEGYAQQHGTDWLLASNSLKQNGIVMIDLADKETVIRDVTEHVERQGKVIADLGAELKYYQEIHNAMPWPMKLISRANVRLARLLRPRIGHLNQYPPRALTDVSSKPKMVHLAPQISLVTPSYGQGRFIERTLRSVLDQNYPNLEYFVQDGGSRDETVSILERYNGSLTGWTSEVDTGQSQAINLGFARTTGDIMGWLNSDDLLLSGSLATVADFFVCHPDVDVVYGNRLMIDEADMEIGRWILPGHDSDVLSWADYVPQETMFWRRSIWEKAGGFIDETFRFAMDWDLLVRFRDAGAKFAHVPQFLGAFRIQEHQKTSATITEIGFQEMDRIRERTLGKVPSKSKIRWATAAFMMRHILVDMGYRVKVRMKQRRSRF